MSRTDQIVSGIFASAINFAAIRELRFEFKGIVPRWIELGGVDRKSIFMVAGSLSSDEICSAISPKFRGSGENDVEF